MTVKKRGPNGKVQKIDEPLNNGQIMVTSKSRAGEPKTAQADLDGYYRVDGLPPGQYEVTASVREYGNTQTTAQVKKHRYIHLNMEVKK